jgi:hypothetical protein
MIAMVKCKLDFEAAQFCREKTTIEAFVSELIDYDNPRAMQPGRRQPQAARSMQRAYSQLQTYGQPQTYGHPQTYGQAQTYGQV